MNGNLYEAVVNNTSNTMPSKVLILGDKIGYISLVNADTDHRGL